MIEDVVEGWFREKIATGVIAQYTPAYNQVFAAKADLIARLKGTLGAPEAAPEAAPEPEPAPTQTEPQEAAPEPAPEADAGPEPAP